MPPGQLLHYLAETQHDKVQHICKLSRIEEDHYVWLDRFTIRNLELLHSSNENAKTLLRCHGSDRFSHGFAPAEAMDDPSAEKPETRGGAARYGGIFDQQYRARQNSCGNSFQEIGDLERLISKVAVGKVNPREMFHLKRALESIEDHQAAMQ